MPSRSMKEHRFWEWVDHNPEAARKKGVKPAVAREFVEADKGRDLSKLPMRVKPK